MKLTAIGFARSGSSSSGASRLQLLCAVVILLLAGCRSANEFAVKGRIVGFSDDSLTVIVAHEEIKGLMPAMTMPFRTLQTQELRGFDYGDPISFRLFVAQDSSWIDSVEKIADTDVPAAKAGIADVDGPVAILPGEYLPSFNLIDQDGRDARLFASTKEAYVVDFVYTRCPIPEFCPMLSNKFREMQSLIQTSGNDAVKLATITVDPAFDSPTVLKAYASRYRAIDDVWSFYTGKQATLDSLYTYLGVSLFESEEQPVAHPLIVAVFLGNGRLEKIWRDGDWQPAEVFAAAQDVLKQGSVRAD